MTHFIRIVWMLLLTAITESVVYAQVPVDLKNFKADKDRKVKLSENKISVSWNAGNNEWGQLVLNLDNSRPLFESVGLVSFGKSRNIIEASDPVFLLTTGKRDLVSQNGWNIFFDKVPIKPHESHLITLDKRYASIVSSGTRTIISIGKMHAPEFSGELEVTLYGGSPLVNIAAVVFTQKDSVAILYDAGLISKVLKWQHVAWADVNDQLQTRQPKPSDTSRNEAVKYRTIIGQTQNGCIAIFPPPHQYFYPLDEAFNLRFTWYGDQYRNMIRDYGLGIRQDLFGDQRYVPWFNAPPLTKQRLNFYCLLNSGDPLSALQEVKRFTRNDQYLSLPGYKKMVSHFHNEFVMKVVLAGKPVPDTPTFVRVFKDMGVDIVHLAEFHNTAHPKGPDNQRLSELRALFTQCRRLSDSSFLLLPGEEPNEFFGGHWLAFFPRPVYWVMSRKEDQPFVSQDSVFGTVYHIADTAEMMDLLKKENGLVWTAHPRTKGSTGFPDTYKNAGFFHSDQFLGAAWKAMPADLSQPRLGKRVLDLQDDMNNWGMNKKVLAEADLFTVEPGNEMYAHMNVNYLQLNQLPSFSNNWQAILNALREGKFFSTTGEVLIPSFEVNAVKTGDTLDLSGAGKAKISFELKWTFPLSFAEIVSGDGKNVYREKINLDSTIAFGDKRFDYYLNLHNRTWVRFEVWDIAANGAFTQTLWLNQAIDKNTMADKNGSKISTIKF